VLHHLSLLLLLLLLLRVLVLGTKRIPSAAQQLRC